MKKFVFAATLLTLVIIIYNFAAPAQADNGHKSKTRDCSASVSHTGVIDQQQCDYNGGLSARTLYGNSIWQSFTAGITGELTEIDMGFFNTINGVGYLHLYSGSGIHGSRLYSRIVSVGCPGDSCAIPFLVSIPVTEGEQYTFQFVPGYGIPDPYGVQISTRKSYSGGTLGIDILGNSDSSGIGYDAVFTTFVL